MRTVPTWDMQTWGPVGPGAPSARLSPKTLKMTPPSQGVCRDGNQTQHPLI